VDFFDGFDYRHDIIDRIDGEVRVAMRELAYGGSVPLALRKLVCYALWGNPVDAYKVRELVHATTVRQPLTTYPHFRSGSSILIRKSICRTGISRNTSFSDISRNLPDKTLNHGLSPATRSTETFELAWRGLMIRALVSFSDARSLRTMLTSLDVLEVLIAEYRFALVRTGHRRGDIDGLVFKAKQRLENERQNPTG
jgi:hypothetical protein